MKIFKKAGDFFAAMIPFFVFFGVQITVALIGGTIAIVSETLAQQGIPEAVSDKSLLYITIAANVISTVTALVEVKLHSFKFSDISPVKQNCKVYISAVFFSIGVFFAFKLVNSLFLNIIGGSDNDYSMESLGSLAYLTLLGSLTISFGEELVYRGLMVKTFEKRGFPVRVAAIAITLPFMLFHSRGIKCYLLLLGAVLLFIRYKFGDLKLCFLVNFVVSPMSYFIAFVSGENYRTVMNIGGVLGFFIAAAAMFFMLKFASMPAENTDNG